MKEKLKSQLRVLLVVMVTSLLSLQLYAQTSKITGTVLNAEDRSPMSKVTIKVKNGDVVTLTGEDGSYEIQAPSTSILIFSYTGFLSQEVSIAGKTTINASLTPEQNMLDQVVVVGYGTQKVKDLTTAVSKLDEKVLQSAPRANIGQALQGTLPGVQVTNRSGNPGSAPKITLRGGASINTPGDPLVIIDGVIRQFNDVASEDIESMQVLKDAASTAIYGARANNGVLLITTKQGKAGKSQINYKFNIGFNQPRYGYNYLGAEDFIYYNRLGIKNANPGITNPASLRANADNKNGYGVVNSDAYNRSFDIRYLDGNENLLQQGWQQMADPLDPSKQIVFKDHAGEIRDALFRRTLTQEHYVSAEGGNDKGKYFASFDYYNEDGIIVGSKYNRFTGNVNGSYKLRPNLEVQSGVLLSTASTYGIPTTESNALYRTLAIWPTFNPWLDEAKTQPNPGNSASDGNPLYYLQKYKYSNDANKVSANASLKWDILPELFIKGSASAYLQEGLNTSFQGAVQSIGTLLSNTYANSIRPSTVTWMRDFQQTYNVVANYAKVFNDKHDFSAQLGAEAYTIKSYQINQLGQNAPFDNITTTNASTVFPVGLIDPTAQIGNFTPVGVARQPQNGSFASAFGILSFFARLGYNYDDRYLFTAVVRRDESSVLPIANKAGYFPGVSFGWNLHNEQFFKDLSISKIVNTFKPRVSYGSNGNIAGLDRYEVQGSYTAQGNYGGATGYLNTGLVNPNLRWEQSQQLNVGLDATFLNNRLSFTMDWFNKINKDLITNINLPNYTGFPTFRTNLGTLQNKGIELSLNATVLNKNDWNINLGANATFVKNKVLRLPNNGNERNRQDGLQVWDANGNLIWVGGIQEGRSIGDVYAFNQLGIFKDQAEVNAVAGNRIDEIAKIYGPNRELNSIYTAHITPGDVNWQDVNGDGTINNYDQVYVGNIYPKWTGGFNGTISYKGLSLYTRWEYALGHVIYNDLVSRTMGQYQGTLGFIDLMKDSWTENNTVTDIPKVYYADQLSRKNYTRINNATANLNSNNSHFYEKGDYLAIREVTLSYNFPQDLMKKTKVFNNARIYVTGSNLGYITSFSGQSPEAPLDTNGRLTGVYTGSFPLPRTYVLGLQVSF